MTLSNRVGALLVGTAFAVLVAGGLRAEDETRDVESLRRRVVELQRRATVGEVETARLRRELDRLSEELAAARGETARCREELAQATAAPAGVGLGGRIEESEVADEGLDLAPPPAPPRELAAAQPAGEPRTPAPVSEQAQELYDDSYTLFHEKRYQEAEAGFQRFLERHAETSLADNALFWIGESRFARGDFAAALEAFTATVERFPEGNKVPDALLEAGKCLESLGDRARAVETYREIVESFAGSAAAAAAAERLQTLR